MGEKVKGLVSGIHRILQGDIGMKIYEYVEMDMNGNVIDEISYENDGDLAQCKGGGESTTKTEPPSWMQDKMPKVADLGWWYAQNRPFEFYPGNTIAGFTPEQTLAQKMTYNRATQGSPLLGQSKDFLSGVLTGKGEGFNNMLEAGLTKIIPGAATQPTSGGMGRSSAWNQAMGQAVGTVAGDYGMQAAQLAPLLAREDYGDIAQLAGLGQEKQSMEQARINEAMQRHQFSQMEPWERLGMFTNLIQGDYGGNVTTTSKGGK